MQGRQALQEQSYKPYSPQSEGLVSRSSVHGPGKGCNMPCSLGSALPHLGHIQPRLTLLPLQSKLCGGQTGIATSWSDLTHVQQVNTFSAGLASAALSAWTCSPMQAVACGLNCS